MATSPGSTPEPTTPAGFNGAAALLDIVQWQLGFWRQNADLSRDMIRGQQDQAIRLWRAQLAALAPRTAPQGAEPFLPFAPMASAFRAAEQFGQAALEAQRGAIDALRSH